MKKSLVYQLKYREGAVLGGSIRVRNMKIRSLPVLEQNNERFRLIDNPINWYYSLAILQTMPVFSFNPSERKEASKVFEQNFDLFMDGYDFALDFDAKDNSPQIAYEDMQRVHHWMIDQKIPHVVRSSGSGFHIVVYSQYVWNNPFNFKPTLSCHLLDTLGKYLEDILDLCSLDTSIYDNRRIWKVPYSMDVKTGNICRPLNTEEIEDFEWDLVSPWYCWEKRKDIFYNRKMFQGSKESIPSQISLIFRDKCSSPLEIWKSVEKYERNTYKWLKGEYNGDNEYS